MSANSKESKAIGTRHMECGNKHEHNKSRVKNFKVGDLVLKIINWRNKMGKCWEGPFEILAFDKKQKGYHVREMEGKFLNDLILADQLCQVAELLLWFQPKTINTSLSQHFHPKLFQQSFIQKNKIKMELRGFDPRTF